MAQVTPTNKRAYKNGHTAPRNASMGSPSVVYWTRDAPMLQITAKHTLIDGIFSTSCVFNWQLIAEMMPTAHLSTFLGRGGLSSNYICRRMGYTLVAKGVEAIDANRIRHEDKMYRHLQDLQGKFIPVSLGIIDLIKPYYYDSGVYEHFMLLSYGGQPVLRELGRVNANVAGEILTALGRIHQLGVLHRDAELRNILYDKRTGRCMMVDLMLADFHMQKPLQSISDNSPTRQRKRKLRMSKHEKDDFAIEMQSLQARLLDVGTT